LRSAIRPDQQRIGHGLKAAHGVLAFAVLDVARRFRSRRDAIEAAQGLPILKLQIRLAVELDLFRLALDHLRQGFGGAGCFLQNHVGGAL